LDNDASHSLSAVVAFRGRDLVLPKGIDGGETLVWASAEELLAHHLEPASNAKAFWKDGFLLYTLWAMGDFCGIIPQQRRTTLYPYTRTGFYQFLHDHGSQISPAVGSRRIKVFNAYNRFEVTIIRMVEKAGINKAFAAIPYIQGDTIRDMLQLCIETRITACGLHCGKRIPNQMTAAGAAAGPRKNYTEPLSAARCG